MHFCQWEPSFNGLQEKIESKAYKQRQDGTLLSVSTLDAVKIFVKTSPRPMAPL